MKEFDYSSYNRKWNECWGVFEDAATNEVFVDKITGVDGWNCEKGVLAFGNLTLRKCRVFLDEGDPEAGYPVIKTRYHEFGSGIYPFLNKKGFVLLTRYHHKTFLVGVRFGSTHESEAFVSPFNGMHEVDVFTHKLPRVRLTNEPSGWLSRKVWWKGDKLYFLKTCIGYIQHSKLIRIADELYTPFIKPLVGDECQIKPL